MEKIFINNNFHYIDLIPLSNGSSWTTERICEQIASKYLAKNANPDWIVIWIDREENLDDSLSIADSIKLALTSVGCPEERIHCLVPDRMSENVILADETLMRAELQNTEYNYKFEGKNGKHELKAILKSVNKHYKETQHGALLLKKVRLKRASLVSKSVEQFLSSFPLDCWWISDGNDLGESKSVS